MRFVSSTMIVGLLALTFVTSTEAQSLDNAGTDFVCAFMPNTAGGPGQGMEVHLTTSVATMVTVEYPVNTPTFSTTVAVNPGAATIVALPVAAGNGWSQNSVQNNSVSLSSNDEFVAYLINRRDFTSDAAMALPVDTMNTEYIVADYQSVVQGAQFVVFAAFDNTTVTITPTANMVGRPAGVPFNVTLNTGEGYYGEASGPGVTLTGTIVSSDLPVGMSNGSFCANVPTGTAACDHLFEVAQPVASWGDMVVVANLPLRPNGTIYRILASTDNTTVTQDGAVIANLDRGQFFETASLAGDHVFAADAPIYVVQYMTGQNSAGATTGDPAMGNMIPFAQYQTNYTFSTVAANQFSQNFLTMIVMNADVGTAQLDGVPVPAASFSPIGTSGFSVARLPLTDGSHTTASTNPHGITVEGYNGFDSYIFPGGALFQFINPAGDANPPTCNVVLDTTGTSATGTATDPLPSEDVNMNGMLDPGEDLNMNGQIDEDTGVFFVTLDAGSDNIMLTVDPFVPGAGSVNFSVNPHRQHDRRQRRGAHERRRGQRDDVFGNSERRRMLHADRPRADGLSYRWRQRHSPRPRQLGRPSRSDADQHPGHRHSRHSHTSGFPGLRPGRDGQPVVRRERSDQGVFRFEAADRRDAHGHR